VGSVSIRDALLAIQTLEQTLELSAALKSELNIPSGKVKSAHLIAPSTGHPLGDLPCFMNWPDASAEERMGNSREDHFTVQVDFFSLKDGPKSVDIALAFFDLAWDAFDAERTADKRLGQSVDYLTLRAERPLFETIEWGGVGHPGFHIFLDLVIFKDVTP
jgi:hypothetical protein